MLSPEQRLTYQSDGPDIKRLLPWRQTKVQPVGGERQHTRLIEDEWTTQPAKTSDKPWTGWTNFEEHQEFPTQLESDDEEQQQGTRAKAVQAPKQPTPQEILEHNVTHLPYRSWCPICVQSRGRQNNHPKQHSKLPIIQLDFGYIPASNNTPQQKTTLERPTTAEQPKSKMRINAIKFKPKDGKQMETTSNEDTQEIENERIRSYMTQKTWIHNLYNA